MPKRDRALKEIKAARRRADRLLDRSAIATARSILDEEVGVLERALGRAYRGSGAKPADPSAVRRLRAAAAKTAQRTADRLARELEAAARSSAEESLRGLTRFAGRLTGTAGPLDDETTFRATTHGPRAALTAGRTRALAGLRQNIDASVRQRLLDTVSREDAKMADVLAAVAAGFEDSWWMAERVIRTEASYAYNAAQVAGVQELAKAHPGVMMRWTELIDDATGKPFDDRVAADSFAMHGQVAAPGDMFTMPGSMPASASLSKKKIASLVGQSWYHPPNRPNDRAVLTPWMPGWGIPAWRFRSGRRVYLQR